MTFPTKNMYIEKRHGKCQAVTPPCFWILSTQIPKGSWHLCCFPWWLTHFRWTGQVWNLNIAQTLKL